MKQAKVLAFCSVGVLIAGALYAQTSRELKLGNGDGFKGQSVSVNLTLTSDQQVQGFVAAADWDGGALQGEDLTAGAALASADVIQPRLQPSFAVLGVVMDADGADNEIINPGTDIVLARLKVKCLGPAEGSDISVTTPLVFRDGTYAADAGGVGPKLDNIIVVGGLSIGAAEGLKLTNGSVTCKPPPPGELKIRDTNGFFGDCVRVPVEMSNNAAVQGYVTAITHPGGITLNRILVGPAGAAADFSQAEVFANGGTLGVVMELDGNPPFNTIPAGTGAVVALYEYCSAPIVDPADCGRPSADYPLTFADMVLGDPLKDNVIVIGGRSKSPALVNGTLRLSVDTNREPCTRPPEMAFAVGSCELVDDPNSPDKDLHIPGMVMVSRGTAESPTCFQVGLWYRSPDDEEPDEALQQDHIQGLSMAVCFDPNCITCKETFSLAGTITEAVGAEFVNVHCENSLADGDPGELIVGILVDALPPFDGQTLPSSRDYLRLLCVDFCVNPQASCENCATTALTFCDGADGRGQVPIKNLASVMNMPVRPQLVDGKVVIRNEPTFTRGDCNGKGMPGMNVDISDAAAVISFLFLTGTWKFNPPCLDACDANDDGRVDLADSVYILRYLFKFDRQPKAPFPDAGPDPSYDKLTCEAGGNCP